MQRCTEARLKKMKIFDSHTHVFPDKIAERAVAHLRELSHFIPAYTNGKYSDLSAQASDAGYTGWMNCPVVTRTGQAHSTNQWSAMHNAWPSLSLGAVHPDDEDIHGILESIMELGLPGLKFHPEYQAFDPLEPKVAPIWDFCQENGLPVLFHAGQDIGFQPPFHSSPATFAELARRYPAMKIVAAHTGGWMNWDEVENSLPGTGVFIDTSFSMHFMKDKSQMLRIIRAMGTNRVMFGTDSPWSDLKTSVNEIKSCGLTGEELEDVFWNTAYTFWNLEKYIK